MRPRSPARLPGSPTLKFVPGPLPEPASRRCSEPERIAPTATLEEARQAAEWAASIDDEELRDLVAKAARASLARAAADRSV